MSLRRAGTLKVPVECGTLELAEFVGMLREAVPLEMGAVVRGIPPVVTVWTVGLGIGNPFVPVLLPVGFVCV